MIDQRLKNIYFATFAKLSIFAFLKHKLLDPEKFRNAWLNLGSGRKYIQGMVNIDGNILQKKDIWLDLNLGLPFPDNSIKGIYHSHLIEHFRLNQAVRLIQECYRVLVPGGKMRIVVPSLDYAIKCFNENLPEKLSDWPRKFDSIGGRFNNFMLCDNQHFLMFDFSFLEELLKKAGFINIVSLSAHQSSYFPKHFLKYEYQGDPELDSSLYVECQKPPKTSRS